MNNKDILFLDEIDELKNIKQKIKYDELYRIEKKGKLQNIYFFIKRFFLFSLFLIGHKLSNKKTLLKCLFYILSVGLLIFTIINIEGSIIVPVLFAVIFGILSSTIKEEEFDVKEEFEYFLEKCDCSSAKLYNENLYGINKDEDDDKALSITKINNTYFVFPELIDFSKIEEQLEWIINLLIEINKIEGKVDNKSIKKLKELISYGLDFNDLFNMMLLTKTSNVSNSKIIKYYNKILKNYKKTQEIIENFKLEKIYTLNFGPESKKIKKDIENKYKKITSDIKISNRLLENTKGNKAKKEITEHIELLDKIKEELNTIRTHYTDTTLVIKKMNIVDDLMDELNYISETEKEIKNIDKSYSKINIINKIK